MVLGDLAQIAPTKHSTARPIDVTEELKSAKKLKENTDGTF